MVDRGADTPPPTGTDNDIAQRVRAAVDAGELRGMTAGPVEQLGEGESYTAWRIGSGERTRVLRLPRHLPHDMPRSMETEFEVLRRVPPELGTSAVALETSSDNPLGTPYMVTTHVPGRPCAPPTGTGGSRPSSLTSSPACTRPLPPVPRRRPPSCRAPASRGRSC